MTEKEGQAVQFLMFVTFLIGLGCGGSVTPIVLRLLEQKP